MKTSKQGGGLRFLQLVSGLVLFAGIFGMMTGTNWGLSAALFGGLGWFGFKMLAWMMHG